MAFFTLNRIERKRLSLFVGCLGIAMLLWLFFSLSAKYTYHIKTHIRYQNPPHGRIFYPTQPDTLNLQVEGTGWQLLFSKLHLKVPFVNVEVGELKHANFIVLSRQLDSINNYLDTDQQLISISPDTLYFDFTERNFKQVPIRLTNKIQFKKQYGIAGPIRFTPESVTVAGPVDWLERVVIWKTDSLKLNDVSSTIDTNLTIRPSFSSKMTVFPGTVHVHIPVAEFTEKTIEVPVKVLNNKRYDVKLLPEKVKVTFLVGLKQYHAIDKETFEATVDLNKWVDANCPQLPVQLLGFPEFCKLIRIEPQVVDFMIKK